jgi:hypothetical protein
MHSGGVVVVCCGGGVCVCVCVCLHQSSCIYNLPVIIWYIADQALFFLAKTFSLHDATLLHLPALNDEHFNYFSQTFTVRFLSFSFCDRRSRGWWRNATSSSCLLYC